MKDENYEDTLFDLVHQSCHPNLEPFSSTVEFAWLIFSGQVRSGQVGDNKWLGVLSF